MLTEALETNNVALDAAVRELDRRRRRQRRRRRRRRRSSRRRGTDGAATTTTTAATTTSDADGSRREGRDREPASNDGIVEPARCSSSDVDPSASRASAADAAAAAAERRSHDDLRRKFDVLAEEANALKNDAEFARERIAYLESELESRDGVIVGLRRASSSATIAGGGTSGISVAADATPRRDDGHNMSYEEKNIAANGTRDAPRGGNLSFLLSAKEPIDYPAMVRQRDLKIKSLEAMVHSSSRIMEKMKLDIERMDIEREESECILARRVEELQEENKTYALQVAGFELAFRNLNDQRTSVAASNLRPSHGDNETVDDDVNMWDENDDGDDKYEESDLKSKNLVLQRTIDELQSSGSFQEDQIENLKAELVRLRVESQQDKECALARLSEENEIITAQRSALETQLVEINKAAGVLRHSLLSSVGSHSPGNGDEVAGSDPVLVAQVVMLENANKVLESSVNSLRSDMHEKLAPLLYRIAMLEEEKRIIKDELNTKLSCRETTISNLENSLRQYRALQQAKKNRVKKKADKNGVEI
ncbi:hypothetical protein ACHAW5_004063 [Stephanodiscus triporus]|uniref:Uncharacterized protein n=1 Tax=Stephanodiscus triporus TaxID=2934178 RepID=A0ABD3QF69_9STRA